MSDKNIYQRIAAVMADVEYVQKDKDVTGGGQNYKAVTHDKVVSVIRKSLVKNGIVVCPEQTHGEMLIQRDVSKEIKMHLYTGTYSIHFVNVDVPAERATVVVQSHANDNGDKAPGKAMTYATKTAMLKIFTLETGEDEESRSAPSGIDVDGVLAEIDKIVNLESLRARREGWQKDCEKAKDKEAWDKIKGACAVRKEELAK